MSLANKPDMILFSGGMPDNNLFPLEEIDDIYNKADWKEKQIASNMVQQAAFLNY